MALFSFLIRSKTTPTNPYVSGAEGKAIWNDRYENLAHSVTWWRIAFVCAVGVSLILSGVIAKIATQSRVVPFVVETHEGVPYAVRPVEGQLSVTDQRLVNFALDQFILNTRTVLADPQAQERLLNNAYAYAANTALDTLQTWFEAHNPYETAQKQTVTVTIIDAMPLSADTWQILWDETVHPRNGEGAAVTTHWIANLRYRMGEVNPHFMTQNPFGLYVTAVSWSQSQQPSHALQGA